MNFTKKVLAEPALVLIAILPAIAGCGSSTTPVGPPSLSPSATATQDAPNDSPRDYQIVDLGTLGGAQSGATAINSNDEIVGSSETPTGDIHPSYGGREQ